MTHFFTQSPISTPVSLSTIPHSDSTCFTLLISSYKEQWTPFSFQPPQTSTSKPGILISDHSVWECAWEQIFGQHGDAFRVIGFFHCSLRKMLNKGATVPAGPRPLRASKSLISTTFLRRFQMFVFLQQIFCQFSSIRHTKVSLSRYRDPWVC